MAASILIADDDAVQRRLVENMVQKCGYETIVVDSGDAAIAALTDPDAPAVDAVVLDLVMPGLDGMGVMAKIRDAGLTIPVIVQTAHGGIDIVVSAMRAGAHDFVVKPVGMERLQVSLRNALNASALKGELQRIRHSREGRLTFSDIITRSETCSRSMPTGLTTKSCAPARIADTTLSMPPCAVCTITGTVMPASRILASTPMPSRPGMTRSSTTASTAGASGAVSAAIAASPESTTMVS
jgi:FixJ family two-component response regulator